MVKLFTQIKKKKGINMSKMINLHLLIIDPQNDFCISQGPNGKYGTLVVPGADADMKRLSDLINRIQYKIEDIHCTLDQHHFYDIAHPIMWIDAHGNHPNPFTIISNQDLKNGIYRTSNPSYMKWALEYTEALEKGGRYPLCIWPPHCLIGSWGSNVVDEVFQEFVLWEEHGNMVNYVSKGSNWKTEHYSAYKAEVPIDTDPSTKPRTDLCQVMADADIILIAGEARSHCVANTIRDLIVDYGVDNASKFIILEDCMSDVPGFESQGNQFVDEMMKLGMKTVKSTDFLI
jgi:nicotinamidase-related amidase